MSGRGRKSNSNPNHVDLLLLSREAPHRTRPSQQTRQAGFIRRREIASGGRRMGRPEPSLKRGVPRAIEARSPDRQNQDHPMPITDALMKGKRGLIMGVANNRSIAWGIAEAGRTRRAPRSPSPTRATR